MGTVTKLNYLMLFDSNVGMGRNEREAWMFIPLIPPRYDATRLAHRRVCMVFVSPSWSKNYHDFKKDPNVDGAKTKQFSTGTSAPTYIYIYISCTVQGRIEEF